MQNQSQYNHTDTANGDRTMHSHDNFEATVKSLGQEIFNKSEKVKTNTFFSKDWWYSRIMDWSMKNESFKTQMFRFVDVLPTLNSTQEITKHLNEYFSNIKGDKRDFTSLFSAGLGMGSLAPGLMAKTIKKNVEQMAKMFITGETPNEALKILKKHRKNNIGFTVDLLGEATLSEKEAAFYLNFYKRIITDLSHDSESWTHHPILDEDSIGPIPKVNVSVKLSSLYSQINIKDWDNTKETLKQRLRQLYDLALQHNVFINIDMESYKHKDLTIEVFKEIIMEDKYRLYPHFGIVIQAYLRDSYEDLQDLTHLAQSRKIPFSIRLVKGAYWDYETIHADQNGWHNPVYSNKKESDANFERCAELLLDNYPHIKLAMGSHNVRSIAAAICKAEQLNLPKNAFEIQMLYGMAEPIKLALVEMGYRIREYAPVGELLPGMAYLVRRLLENTSNESFLRSKFAENTSTEILLENPAHELNSSSGEPQPSVGFNNEPPLDFAILENRQQMLKALNHWKSHQPPHCPIVINGEMMDSNTIIESINPSNKSALGSFAAASIEQADQALQVARQSFESWKNTAATERARYVDQLAHLIQRDRIRLAALEVLEVGKTWAEADADIIEAIDFCRYYAEHMRELSVPQKVGKVLGETSFYHYQPRGVSLVIAPWNFPLAILTGMVSASLAAGNSVIMKPAEQSTLIAYELMKLIEEAGIPKGVVSFLPGIGEEVGPHLTGHKDVDMISFTGSKAVGLDILQKASQILPGQKNIKKCIIEMGGKNAVIIDNDADLDEAVDGVIYAAFAFQGQKCSACSRVIVLEEIYDKFLQRLVESTKSIHVAESTNPQAYLGPVIDEESYQRIQGFIERAKDYATLAHSTTVSNEGYFVGPTIFTDVDAKNEIAQSEIFGPVLAVIKVKDIQEALEVANGTEYALTGGIYSRSPGNIELIKQSFQVGNLYINRPNTGAIVDRHPFGGFKMSGLGSKTGGKDYLLQYLEPRVITENVMRRGFAPIDEESESTENKTLN